MTSLVSTDMRIAPPETSLASGARKSRQGRRLVNPDAGGKDVRPVDISDIDELQKILERDADAIINMKRDITNAQKAEVHRAQTQLLKSQKDYDAKKIENKRKQHTLSQLLDKEKELERLQSVRGSQGSQNESTVQKLKGNIHVIEEKLAADKRTLGVMNLMFSRIQQESEQLRSESQVLSQQLEIKKTELLGLNSTIRSSRQELLEEERRYDDLVKMVKNRAQQRVEKMGQLQSLLLLNGSFEDTTVPETGEEAFDIESFTKPFARFPREKNIPASRGSTSDTTNTMDRDVPELNKEQMMEAIDRYNNRKSRVEKLTNLQNEFRDRIKSLKAKKIELEDHVQKAAQSHSALASNRQLYQEVDSKDNSLNTVKRDCLSCKNKDEKLQDSLDSLRRFIPRLLGKITKVNQPVPTPDQLPDALHKLDDEISRLIKLIGETLLREATPEDLAAALDQGGTEGVGRDDRSESARLRKLPGFSRLQKQLWVNLMSAQPDSTPRNIRIPSESTRLNTILHAPESQQRPHMGSVYTMYDGGNASNAGDGVVPGMMYDPEFSLDRGTVKDISKMVVERDQAKARNKRVNNSDRW